MFQLNPCIKKRKVQISVDVLFLKCEEENWHNFIIKFHPISLLL